jgi:hypothetical protein
MMTGPIQVWQKNPTGVTLMVGKFNKFQESGSVADLPHSSHLVISKDGKNTTAKYSCILKK